MSYGYDDYEDEDIDSIDYPAQKKEKEQKKQVKDNSRQNSQKREQSIKKSNNPDQVASVLQSQTKLHTSLSQKHIGDLIDEFKQRSTDEVPENVYNLAKQINVITMGNVDAGKSTIFGHLAYLLDAELNHEFGKLQKLSEQLNKASFKYAYYLDTNEQERERGLTIQVNTHQLTINDKVFVLQDCPGHADFSDSICQSIINPDVGVLVVEASQFDRLIDQISDQLNLILIFNIQNLIVIVNKMDCVNYDKTIFVQIKKKMNEIIEKIAIFQKQTIINFIPLSGVDEIDNNIIMSSEKLKFAEQTLKQALLTTKRKELRVSKNEPFLLVQDLINKDGKNYLHCYVLDGQLFADDTLVIKPINYVIQITDIYDLQYKILDTAIVGMHVVLQYQPYNKNVPQMTTQFECSILKDKVQCGQVLAMLGATLSGNLQVGIQPSNYGITKRVRAKVYITDRNGICSGEEFDGYIGIFRVPMRVRKVDAVMEDSKFIIGKQFCQYQNFCVIDVVLEEPAVIQLVGVLKRIILRRGVLLSAVGLVEAYK